MTNEEREKMSELSAQIAILIMRVNYLQEELYKLKGLENE